jgi:hypothetical protein
MKLEKRWFVRTAQRLALAFETLEKFLAECEARL